METKENLKEKCITYLTAIASPETEVCLSEEEADYLNIDTWDKINIIEEDIIDG